MLNPSQNCETLIKLLICLAFADKEDLGWDPTVRPAEETDYAMWCEVMSEQPVRLLNRIPQPIRPSLSTGSNASSYGHRLFRVKVNGDNLKTAKARWDARGGPHLLPKSPAREFIIGRHSMAQRSLVGRGTKGFVAVDPITKELVYLKDCWKGAYPNIKGLPKDTRMPEIVVYSILAEKKVHHIATVVCGGDVEGDGRQNLQTSLTDQYFTSCLPRIHTRLVLEEIGIPLDDHACSEELVRTVYDAFRGLIVLLRRPNRAC